MHIRWQLQIAEALGDDNRWFCSSHHGRRITDHDMLMTYYCRNGGAADFGRRWKEATGELNRWFCSEWYGYKVSDEETLWDYYMTHRQDAEECPSELQIAFLT